MESQKTTSKINQNNTALDWQQVKTLFQELIELPPSQHSSFLNKVCGSNDLLRKELESLIAADMVMGNFIVDPVLKTATRDKLANNLSSFSGKSIGQYKIVNEIGRGGMGRVFLAIRSDGSYEQKVAIKLVKSGFDSEFIVRRLSAERRILARLNHPNIAQLYDGGLTEDGDHYFVMEYVEGKPIDEYSKENKLSLEEKLKLFCKVCSAIQFAHQQLIIHCDIKPSNVLVTLEGKVKLLDFGIARLLDSEQILEGKELTIATRQIMTPEYASPEQVRGENLSTTSDVYSLGILLYKLLSDNLPYQLNKSSIQDIANVICQTPATAISKFTSECKGDLENVLMMALNKEPQRRYVSVERFLADIENFLQNKPVSARKDSFIYRSKKFIQRNRVGVTVSILIAILLLSSILAVFWQARIAELERAKAEQRFEDVRALAKSYIFEIHTGIKNLPGSTPTRKILVERGLEYLNKLASDASNDPLLMSEIALSYCEIGDIQGGRYQQNIGDEVGSKKSYRKAIEILENLIAKNPANPDLERNLAYAYEKLVFSQISLEETSILINKATFLRESLAQKYPSKVEDQCALANNYSLLSEVYFRQGDITSKYTTLKKAYEILKKVSSDRSNPEIDNNIANIQLRMADMLMFTFGDTIKNKINRPDLAEKFYEQALNLHQLEKEQSEVLTKLDPNNAKLRRSFAGKLYDVAWALAKLGQFEKALENANQAEQIFKQLSLVDPINLTPNHDLITVKALKGYIFLQLKNYTQAIVEYSQALAINEKIKNDSLNASYVNNLIRFNADIAEALLLMGKAWQALKYFDMTIELIEKHTFSYKENLPPKNRTFSKLIKLSGSTDKNIKLEADLRIKRLINFWKKDFYKSKPTITELKEFSWILFISNELEQAKELSKKAVKLSKEKDIEALNTFGLILEKLGFKEESLSYKQKVISLLDKLTSEISIS